MNISKTVTDYCHQCKKEVDYNLILAKVDYNGICPSLECQECGKIIPAFTFAHYVRTGQIIIGM